MRTSRFLARLALSVFLSLLGLQSTSVAGALDPQQVLELVKKNRLDPSRPITASFAITESHSGVELSPETREKVAAWRAQSTHVEMESAPDGLRGPLADRLARISEELTLRLGPTEGTFQARYLCDGMKWRRDLLRTSPFVMPPGGKGVYDNDVTVIFDGQTAWQLYRATDENRRAIGIPNYPNMADVRQSPIIKRNNMAVEYWAFPPLDDRTLAALAVVEMTNSPDDPNVFRIVLKSSAWNAVVTLLVDSAKDFSVTDASAVSGTEVLWSWTAREWEKTGNRWVPRVVKHEMRESPQLVDAYEEATGDKSIGASRVTTTIELKSVDFSPRSGGEDFVPDFPAPTNFFDCRFGDLLTYESDQDLHGAEAVNRLAQAALLARQGAPKVKLSQADPLEEDAAAAPAESAVASAPGAPPPGQTADDTAAGAPRPQPSTLKMHSLAVATIAGVLLLILLALAASRRSRRRFPGHNT